MTTETSGSGTRVAGDEIATVVLEAFDALPKKRKPQARKDGVREWVPLSGIVAQDLDGVKCVALGTGMKCLPASKIRQAKGTVLHDWHAEIVAIRAFNRFILEECKLLGASGAQESRYVRRTGVTEAPGSDSRYFSWKQHVKLYMYCSEAPCGDASMELTIAAQDDSTPWELPTLSLNPSTAAAAVVSMNGRGYFSQLGVVRRKPSRPDAPPTLSKSCSDKIALHQCTSLLSSMASLIMSPENVYIHSLVLPQSQYSAVGCERCFSSQGRMTKLTGFIWGEGYKFSPFNTMTTTCEFGFSRRAFQDGESAVPSNLAAVWTPHGQENLIGGVLQGRKLFDPKGASMLSKQRMWQLVNEIIEVLNGSDALVATLQGTYIAVKNSPALKERRKVKNEVRDLLQGWTPNVGDESFSLENNKCSIAF